jgi:hypothetical protein
VRVKLSLRVKISLKISFGRLFIEGYLIKRKSKVLNLMENKIKKLFLIIKKLIFDFNYIIEKSF